MPPLVDDEKDELLLSCRFGDIEDVQAFVDRHGSAPLADIRDENQSTILHMAAGNGHLDVLRYLLPLVPTSLLSAQNHSGSTPLHWAAVNSHLDVSKALVEFPKGPGVDLIDIKNAAGHSPLAEAEFAGWDEGAKWFVEVMNLDSEEAGKEEGDPDAVVDPSDGPQIEVEIQDAEGQIAKMKIGGKASTSDPPSSTTS
ncbi:hypothetical protein EST38_g861 [Candolleomyces aberdarensis]|uniref:Uncharacterized protein n=1 Tax=Candolleomyces aberdarensis TaxID=2316362 RepID=A0A4Q2DYH7_9AGAR|nr:hypothetical protein EST38_g861 [Candolleomyces aberdarensis]